MTAVNRIQMLKNKKGVYMCMYWRILVTTWIWQVLTNDSSLLSPQIVPRNSSTKPKRTHTTACPLPEREIPLPKAAWSTTAIRCETEKVSGVSKVKSESCKFTKNTSTMELTQRGGRCVIKKKKKTYSLMNIKRGLQYIQWIISWTSMPYLSVVFFILKLYITYTLKMWGLWAMGSYKT